MGGGGQTGDRIAHRHLGPGLSLSAAAPAGTPVGSAVKPPHRPLRQQSVPRRCLKGSHVQVIEHPVQGGGSRCLLPVESQQPRCGGFVVPSPSSSPPPFPAPIIKLWSENERVLLQKTGDNPDPNVDTFGDRGQDKDISLPAENAIPTGIRLDGETMFAMDNADDKIYAHALPEDFLDWKCPR